MTKDETQFPVMLAKGDVETILHALFECRVLRTHTAQEQDLKSLSDKLEARLSMRVKDLERLEDLMNQPDYQIGI